MRDIVMLEVPVRWWKCPACLLEDRTQQAGVHTQFHHCRAMNGAAIPLVEVKHLDDRVKARQIAVPREDNGKLASIRTERLDGSNDCTVFAEVATADGVAHNRS